MRIDRGTTRKLVWAILFGGAFAFVESSIVIYLRALYYPEGFSLPLKTLPAPMVTVELIREASTILMLTAVAMIAGRKGWPRFGYFLLMFGVWDLLFYAWLRIMIGWPGSLTEWDILFLIPLPWIGPVIAPALVALLMTVCGGMIVARCAAERHFRPGVLSWLLAIPGAAVLLFSFMADTDATLRGAAPHPYRYELLGLSLVAFLAAFVLACRAPLHNRDGHGKR